MSTLDGKNIFEVLVAEKHGGQRYGDGSDYIDHLFRVAFAFIGKEDNTLYAAALMHDILEDTDATRDEIAGWTSKAVADIVVVLTRREDETYREYIARVAENKEATQIKLMDLLDNLSNCVLQIAGGNTQKDWMGMADRYAKAAQQLLGAVEW